MTSQQGFTAAEQEQIIGFLSRKVGCSWKRRQRAILLIRWLQQQLDHARGPLADAREGQSASASPWSSEREGVGHLGRAGNGQACTAPPSRSEDDAGQVAHASDGQAPRAPSSSPPRAGAGHGTYADKARVGLPRPGSPASQEPLRLPKGRSLTEGRLQAQRAVARTDAAIVLQLSMRTRIAGRAYGDWTADESYAHWRRNRIPARDTLVLRLSAAEAVRRGAAKDTPFRECLDEPTMLRITREAERFIDAA